MTDKLKPCPFCGGESKLEITTECWGHGEYHENYFIKCMRCGSRGKSEVVYDKTPRQCEADCIENWNRRTNNDR